MNLINFLRTRIFSLFHFIGDFFQNTFFKQKKIWFKEVILSIFIVFIFLRIYPFFLPPRIVSFFPIDDKNVSRDAKIEIVFNKPVIKFLVEKSFRLVPAVKGSFNWEGSQKLIFTPKDKLKLGTRYQLKFSFPIFSFFAIPLVNTPSYDFYTEGGLEVILASPQGEIFDYQSPIIVVFNRPVINLTTATESGKIVPIKINPKIEGNGRWLNTKTYQFQPSMPVDKGIEYEVLVEDSLKSVDGDQLIKPYAFKFSTERPRVIETSPLSGDQYVSPFASVSAKFNFEVDPESLKDKFILFDNDNNRVPGRLVTNRNEIGFYPEKPLVRDMVYQARIKKEIRMVKGNKGMEKDHVWFFTIAPKPLIIKTTPVNNQKDVDEEYQIQVYFNSPMNEESFSEKIIIDPEPKEKLNLYFSSYRNANILYINTYLSRGKKYSIKIKGDVKNHLGENLGKDYSFSFTTAKMKPTISIFSNDPFLAFNRKIIPRVIATVVNSKKVDYELYRLKKDDFVDLFRRRYGSVCSQENCRFWLDYDLSKLKKIHSWQEEFQIEDDNPTRVVTKVTDNEGNNLSSGFYLLNLKIENGFQERVVLIVSESVLTFKQSPNQIFVWVVNQTNGEVIPGMEIELLDINGKKLTKGKTNKDGVYSENFSFPNDQYFWLVFGKKEDEETVISNIWNNGIASYDFGLNYYYESESYNQSVNLPKQHKIFLTLDRPIYRPGQKVYFKGFVREVIEGFYQKPEPGEQVLVEIVEMRNNRLIFSKDYKTNSFGSFFGNYSLGNELTLGNYQITASYKDSTYRQEFQVEEYRKQDLIVEVKTEKENFIQNQNVEVLVSASYFFGSPASNLPLEWSVDKQKYFFVWEKDRNFDFDDEDFWINDVLSNNSLKKKTEGKGITDDQGNFSINLPLDLSEEKTSQRIIFESVVNDINNQKIAGSDYFTVHKCQFYVGLKPEGYNYRVNNEVKIETVVVNFEGEEIKNRPIKIYTYKRTWETIREKNPDDGRFYYRNKAIDSLIEEKELLSNEFGRSTFSFIPKEGGLYKISANVNDDFGNNNKASIFIWVSGENFSYPRENNDRILVKTDKDEYLVGEKIKVFVATPFASESAKTLLTLERDKVIDYQVVETSEIDNNFLLSINQNYVPNIFISALLVRSGDQLKKPAEFKIGYTEVRVINKKQKINLLIKPNKNQYHPKEIIDLQIETKDGNGSPIETEIAIGLVDKAVWDLTPISLPDPYEKFFYPQNLHVKTSQILTISLDRINANTDLGSKGGSGGGGEGGINTSRKKFLDTAFWSPNIKTNKQGKALIKIPLPDNLTTWKLTAVANSEIDSFGSSTTEIKVSQEIMIRPFLPRFLIFGDEPSLGAIIFNRSGSERKLKVKIESDNLNIKDNNTKHIVLKENQQTKIVWSVKVKNQENTKINIAVTDDENKKWDQLEVNLPTKPFSVPETTVSVGKVQNNSVEKIFLPRQIDTSLGNLTISLINNFGLKGLKLLGNLYHYPYQCIEQVTSKFLGSIYVMRVLKRYDLERVYFFDKKLIEKNIQEGIQQIINRQNLDGGWGWWQGDKSDVVLSGYVYLSFLEAEKDNIIIDAKVLDKAKKFLESALFNDKSFGFNLTLEDKAYLVYVLKNKNKKLLNQLNYLFNHRFDLSYEKRAQLAIASLFIEKKPDKAMKIYQELLSVAKKSGETTHWEEPNTRKYFGGSTINTTTAILDLILTLDRNNPLIPEIFYFLLMTQKNDYRTTTYENQSMIKLFSNLLLNQKSIASLNQRYRIEVNQKKIEEGEINYNNNWGDEIKKIVPISQLLIDKENQVKISKLNQGDLYYHINLNYYLPFDIVNPFEAGFMVYREFFDNKGEIIKEEKIKANEDLLVRLTLIVPESRYYVVVEDFLPAGLEPINESLKNVSIYNTKGAFNRSDLDKFNYFSQKEFRDDRVVFFANYLPKGIYVLSYRARSTTNGRYHHPPTLAYQMYVPSVFGRSKGGWFIVE